MKQETIRYLSKRINALTKQKLKIENSIIHDSENIYDIDLKMSYTQKIERIDASILIFNYLIINACGCDDSIKEFVGKIQNSPSLSEERKHLASRTYKLPSMLEVIESEIINCESKKDTFFSSSKNEKWVNHLFTLKEKVLQFSQDLNDKDCLKKHF